MEWDEYTDTGMLNAGEEFHSCSHGAIKPTYRIDDDNILHTVSQGDEHRLHTTREIYQQLEPSDVPAPAVYHDAAGAAVPYLVVEAVDGTNPEDSYRQMDDSERETFAYQAGEALGHAHHELTSDSTGTIQGASDGIVIDEEPWNELLTDHMRSKLDYLSETDINDQIIAETNELLTTIEAEIPEPDQPGILHLDYRPGNLMWDGREIQAVLDWDNARSGDRLYDYVNAEVSFITNTPEHHQDDVKEAFREGYEETMEAIEEDQLYDIYTYLSILSKTKGLLYVNEKYEAGREERAARFTDRFLEMHGQMIGSQDG